MKRLLLRCKQWCPTTDRVTSDWRLFAFEIHSEQRRFARTDSWCFRPRKSLLAVHLLHQYYNGIVQVQWQMLTAVALHNTNLVLVQRKYIRRNATRLRRTSDQQFNLHPDPPASNVFTFQDQLPISRFIDSQASSNSGLHTIPTLIQYRPSSNRRDAWQDPHHRGMSPLR